MIEVIYSFGFQHRLWYEETDDYGHGGVWFLAGWQDVRPHPVWGNAHDFRYYWQDTLGL